MAQFLKRPLLSMMKEGHKIMDDPVYKNIENCKELSAITRTSFGPFGLNKLVINYLGKIFITHDAATIMNELDVEHPAAKLLVQACKAMQEEVGDGTNLTLILAGEFLSKAQPLIRMGLHTSDIIQGYVKCGDKALEHLAALSTLKVDDPKNLDQVIDPIRTAIQTKQPGYASHLAPLVAKACINVCPANPKSFNVDNVRVAKLEGGGILDSEVMHGFVIARDAEGSVRKVADGKVAVYNTAIDNANMETKGQVLIKTAEELKNFSKTEEAEMEKIISNIAATGVKVIVSTQSFGDLALHFIERNGIMAVKVPSKFDLRRLCSAISAKQIMSLDPPTQEELGRCSLVEVREIAGHKVTVFEQSTETSRLSTIIVRGATSNMIADAERAIDDGINTYKAISRDGRMALGRGEIETKLSHKLMEEANQIPGVDQHAMRAYAEAFQVVQNTLAQVEGISIEEFSKGSAEAEKIYDAFLTKFWAVKLATDAAVTVLRVDQIIMAKAAGGPRKDRAPAQESED